MDQTTPGNIVKFVKIDKVVDFASGINIVLLVRTFKFVYIVQTAEIAGTAMITGITATKKKIKVQ